MIELTHEAILCRQCGRGKLSGEPLSGPRMWNHWQPTCRHEEFYTCPECRKEDWSKVRCSQCGSTEFYT